MHIERTARKENSMSLGKLNFHPVNNVVISEFNFLVRKKPLIALKK